MMEEQRRKRVQVKDPLAPVRLSPVRVNGHSVTHQGVEIQVDDGSWEAINIHSADYNLVPNRKADEVSQRILMRSSLNWTKMHEVWTGRYWARLYKSDNSMAVHSVGDAISLGLRVENSYDGSCQFRLVLMAYVLSCLNGLVSPQNFGKYNKDNCVLLCHECHKGITYQKWHGSPGAKKSKLNQRILI